MANLVDSVSKGGHDVAALRVALDPHELPIETGRDHADELLARHWPAVQIMATTLLRERTLTGTVVTELLAPLLPAPGVPCPRTAGRLPALPPTTNH
ncbi:hypothetical protein [Nocardia sp. NPDC059239]|uniref:hypothetical protein n=1 Tax=Nocardia sp. NPDC059239 TaxID=3346785 RepID=UPI00367372B3